MEEESVHRYIYYVNSLNNSTPISKTIFTADSPTWVSVEVDVVVASTATSVGRYSWMIYPRTNGLSAENMAPTAPVTTDDTLLDFLSAGPDRSIMCSGSGYLNSDVGVGKHWSQKSELFWLNKDGDITWSAIEYNNPAVVMNAYIVVRTWN